MPATYTVKQVAKLLGYSTNSIYTFLKEKRLKGTRVGKGRFRIPQSEVNKILLSGQTEAVKLSEVRVGQHAKADSSARMQTTADLQGEIQELSYRDSAITVPNLFDWFVGVSSIVYGFAMWLFSSASIELSVLSLTLVAPILRTDAPGFVASINLRTRLFPFGRCVK